MFNKINIYPNILYNLLLSYHILEKKYDSDYVPYQDVETVMYEIEETHFKRQITESNKKMINSCNTLICYVDKKKNPSGAKSAMNYAKRNGLKIINLFKEEDDPTYGMSKDEKNNYYNNLRESIKNATLLYK